MTIVDKDIFMLVSEQEEVIMICLARKDKGGLLTDLSMLDNERFRVEISIIGCSSRIEMMVINVCVHVDQGSFVSTIYPKMD